LGINLDKGDHSGQIVRFGLFEADLQTGELRKSGIKVPLQGQPFQVCEILLTHSGDLVTREELRQQVWPEDTFVDFDHALNTAITKLRLALGDEADNPRFVETLPRRAGRAPTAMHILACSGESPLLIHPGTSLASSGSIPLPIVRVLLARSELAASAQCGVQACALQI
jgi:DNA-binding winged helix-turn-helix (wHTH) protein